ncbi:hypothetical protein CYMTET_57090 [Cymbomonas tetramitiformis]|uniref:Uncharacterized protein n=1 Tax=Cymbomonas tetramitiformis TaxID=36881 RepID=A0AAE0EL65_9CHLO|nr:hypothetical protein CYMTET_57090 [Cymbomonas tetramitiformis]
MSFIVAPCCSNEAAIPRRRELAIIADTLRCCCNDTFGATWEDALPLVEFVINNSVSETTGYTPFSRESMATPLARHDLVV